MSGTSSEPSAKRARRATASTSTQPVASAAASTGRVPPARRVPPSTRPAEGSLLTPFSHTDSLGNYSGVDAEALDITHPGLSDLIDGKVSAFEIRMRADQQKVLAHLLAKVQKLHVLIMQLSQTNGPPNASEPQDTLTANGRVVLHYLKVSS
jgi:hypothetical protein